MITHPQMTPLKRPRLSETQRSAILREVKKGAAIKELARRYGVTPQTIRNVVRRRREEAETAKVRSVIIGARVSEAEARAFDVALSRLGDVSRSAAVRAFARQPEGFLTPDAELAETVLNLRRDFSALGNNINQIARRLNSPMITDPEKRLSKSELALITDLRAQLVEANATLDTLLGIKRRRGDHAFVQAVKEFERG